MEGANIKTVIRKMLKNRWMMLCLLLGVVIAASMISSIPQYSDGILQKVLTKDLESYQEAHNVFPGTYYISDNFVQQDFSQRVKEYENFDKTIEGFFKGLHVPSLNNVTTIDYDYLNVLTGDSRDVQQDTVLKSMSGIASHIKLVYGHLPSQTVSNGVYEVMLTQTALKDMDMDAGQTYEVIDRVNENAPSFKVKVTGVFEPKQSNDSYWYNSSADYDNIMFMNYSLMNSAFASAKNMRATGAEWYLAMDYHKISLENLSSVTANLKQQNEWLIENSSGDQEMPALSILESYASLKKQLEIILLLLEIPVMLMLVFYLFMVAQLIMEDERNEIAVLKSRGASRLQIFRSYLYESLLLGGFALVVGPLIGLLLSSILGSSNGFLEFVQRTSLNVRLNFSSYCYALAAVGIFIVTMLVPVFFASKTTIVLYKQQKRRKKAAFWKKYFIDVILLAISLYGIYSYHTNKKILNFSSGSLSIDPLLFFVSTLFILSTGLLFIRFYPYLIQLIFRIGRKSWKPTTYASLLSVSRSGGKEQFLILFLIFTVSVGIFSATAARTINANAEQKIDYSTGADITLTPDWQVDSGTTAAASTSGPPSSSTGSSSSSESTTTYIEPNFDSYAGLKGIKNATRVYISNSASVVTGSSSSSGSNSLFSAGSGSGNSNQNNNSNSTSVRFMAIDPGGFGRTAIFRTDLLPTHWFNYLNLMAKAPQALLLSRSFQTKYNVKLGDEVDIDLGSIGTLRGVAYAFVDYWPTCNPNEVEGSTTPSDFIIGNLSYMQEEFPIQPYQIWLKKSPGATSKTIYSDIEKKGLKVSNLTDASQEIIETKNSPVLEGINGTLTLGFLVTLLIAGIGFLIYWIMSIRSRTLQFGILRAMGLSFKELLGMLVFEQVLISVAAILFGAIIGAVTSYIFVPMLQIAFGSGNQVPPFEVVVNAGDYVKIFVVMAIILASGLAVLGTFISRLKMDQALKLGED